MNDKQNNNAISADEQASSTPISTREAFFAWLSIGNAKKYHPQSALDCLDRISAYIISKKISCSIWEISKPNTFQPVYQRVLEAKLLRIMEKNTYKTFIDVGKLYMSFLKEKPWEKSMQTAAITGNTESAESEATYTKPEEFVLFSSNKSPCNDILFRKEVDWSLLHYGFSVPQAVVESFCANLHEDIPRGGSAHVSLAFNDGGTYPAVLSNVGFKNSSRQQLQIRYNSTSPIAARFREIFSKRYKHFVSVRNNTPSGDLDINKEYIEIACKGINTYEVACIPAENTIGNQGSSSMTTASNEAKEASSTIKKAIVCVLKNAQHPMTAASIYDSIISHGLYTFSAQNPVNVVRTTLEYACLNSGYTNRDAVPLFRFEKNGEGKRIYSLLDAADSEHTKDTTGGTEIANMEKPLVGCSIWNTEIEQAFPKWLENGHYSKKTAENYRRAAAQLFRDYASLAQQAMSEVPNAAAATSRWVALLGNNPVFLRKNSTRHNQFSAALSALERFHLSAQDSISVVDDESFGAGETSELQMTRPSLSSIVDLEEGKAGIREILEAHFQVLYGYSNINILWNAAQDKLSLFLNDNGINSADGLWMFIDQAFSGEYVMCNPHIWKKEPGYPKNCVGLIVNLAMQFGGFVTREQIDEYFLRIKQAPPFNTTIIRQGSLLFYAPKHFIVSEAVNLTYERCSAIEKSLTLLFAQERVPYIVLRDIAAGWFSTLPAIKSGVDWTALLLQEVLRLRPDIGYRVIFSGLNKQALDTLGTAVVPTQSEIHSFADVAHRYCYEQEILGKRMPAEDLRLILRKAGMLEGNELIYNLHKALRDYRFAFTDENRMVKILER